jgi:transposase InsO family protein
MNHKHDITQLCAALEVARAGYYAWLKAEPSQRAQKDKELLQRITEIHGKNRGRYGSPRIHHVLEQSGQRHGRKRIARIMRRHGIRALGVKRFVPRTTDSNHDRPVPVNRLREQPSPLRPNQIWVSDLTYVFTQEGWMYLAVIMDLWSRRIVGWACGASLHSALAIAALQMALQHRQPPKGLIHHSDRGLQYASAQYRQLLQDAQILCSMSRTANPYDNAAMESFMATYKRECVGLDPTYRTRQEAGSSFFDYAECYYNRDRFHSALGYKSPVDFENTLN